MQRLIAGAGLVALALAGCGSRTAAAPVPHIVAVGVETTITSPAPVTTTPPVQKLAVGRASRGERRVRLAAATVVVGDDVWARLARCESGGNPQAVGGRGKFFGAFQFSLRTWHSMGMSGNPVDYSYADQLAAAKRLQARSGWRNWPVCARRAIRV
jgi:hypothetical protein